MPISGTGGYSFHMNSPAQLPQKSLRFCIEADAALVTLEAALAIVRRAGIALCGLRTSPGRHGMEVWMRLAAEDDALMLCRMRLHNVVGILKVQSA